MVTRQMAGRAEAAPAGNAPVADRQAVERAPERSRRSIEFFPGGEYGPVAPEVVAPGVVASETGASEAVAPESVAPEAAAPETDDGHVVPDAGGPDAAGWAAGWDDDPWVGPAAIADRSGPPAALEGGRVAGGARIADEPIADEPTGAPAEDGADEAVASGVPDEPAGTEGRERISLDEFQARVRKTTTAESGPGPGPARAGPGRPGRRRIGLVAVAVAGALLLAAIVAFGTRSNWFSPVTGHLHTNEGLDRARTESVEQGRRAGVEEGRRAGVEEALSLIHI